MKRALCCSIFCMAALATHAQSVSWTGTHIGLSFGGNAYTSNWTDVDGYKNGASVESIKQRFKMGASLGYDYQFGTTVLGVEFDRTLSAEKSTSSYYSGSVLRTDNLQRLATLRLRAGLAYGTTLLYLTGGLGQSKAEHAWIDSGANGQSWQTFHNSRRGLVTGVGLESRLDSDFAFRVEFLNFRSGAASSTNGSGYTMRVTDNVNTFRAALSYYF